MTFRHVISSIRILAALLLAPLAALHLGDLAESMERRLGFLQTAANG